MIIQILILAALLLVLPVCTGSILACVDKRRGNLLFQWVGGQFLLWTGFQLVCVPLIMRERSFSRMTTLYWFYIAALLLLAAAVNIRRGAKKVWIASVFRRAGRKMPFSELLLWLLFWGFLCFQLIQAVRLAYADGDDAYYVAISSITVDSDTMYQKLPYTGGATLLDGRHGLAPFPVWIAFLAKTSGMPAVTVAQVALPVVLLCMTYGIFYLAGVRLFPEKGDRLPLFLLFTELLVLFGDYSFYTAENFMIARTSQGKAVLGSIVIPFLILLFLILFGKIREKERISWKLYLLFGMAVVTGCLCSTMGALLCGMLVGTAGLAGSICSRRFRMLFPLAACCIPCICYAVLYLILD